MVKEESKFENDPLLFCRIIPVMVTYICMIKKLIHIII